MSITEEKKMKAKSMIAGAVAVAGLCMHTGSSAEAAGFELQQLEAVQLMTVGAGTAAGQAYNFSGFNPTAVGLTSPFVSVSFQNENAYDISLANAFASSVGGSASAFVFAGNNVKFAPDSITIR
ncbi:hypothetical protein Plut_0762 [Pelodictyon luteolum DSM 273]|uniref:PEP-CTERM sorting domain-containing protein n=2 Tax=Pelodictyon luteolum TaxID=1100 RepID=Q3B4U6_CHLL3|nr:hypothetical protein Plut_0762 [Pelodictyon luteolum DSM 273]